MCALQLTSMVKLVYTSVAFVMEFNDQELMEGGPLACAKHIQVSRTHDLIGIAGQNFLRRPAVCDF